MWIFYCIILFMCICVCCVWHVQATMIHLYLSISLSIYQAVLHQSVLPVLPQPLQSPTVTKHIQSVHGRFICCINFYFLHIYVYYMCVCVCVYIYMCIYIWALFLPVVTGGPPLTSPTTAATTVVFPPSGAPDTPPGGPTSGPNSPPGPSVNPKSNEEGKGFIATHNSRA